MIEPHQLAAYLGTSSLNEPRADLLLRYAEAEVASVTGVLLTVPVWVEAITMEVAARAYRNPQGFSMEQAGPFMGRREGAGAAAGIYLTDDEEAKLRRAAVAVPIGSVYSVVLHTPADVSYP